MAGATMNESIDATALAAVISIAHADLNICPMVGLIFFFAPPPLLLPYDDHTSRCSSEFTLVATVAAPSLLLRSGSVGLLLLVAVMVLSYSDGDTRRARHIPTFARRTDQQQP